MTSGEQVHAWVFRKNKETFATRNLVDSLARLLDAGRSSGRGDLSALIAAGELECALADAADPASAFSSQLTDALAATALDPRFGNRTDTVAILAQIASMMRTTYADLSPAEGFAYYGLHPLEFAKVIENPRPDAAAIIGVRSIGTVLSAVLAMELARNGCDSSRITVRPQGHPYDRRTNFDEQQMRWIRDRIRMNCEFFVVDEGPGLSGSSLLSVGEALECEEVPAERITFLGTREPDPARLCAADAVRRWARFRFHCVPSKWTSAARSTNWSGGEWRKSLFLSESCWPACWTQMESVKFRSVDGPALLKFEGLGRFGEVARDRARTMSKAGFGPEIQGIDGGLTRYIFVPGRALTPSDVSSDLLQYIAKYCAFRAIAFPAVKTDFKAVSEMARFNLAQEFGGEAHVSDEPFATESPVIVDGHMHPHEWIRTPSGKVYKMDGNIHGDDHFFPGPTDIAWDLAGAIVEWDLNLDATNYLLKCYRKFSADDAAPRLQEYLRAYAVFRLGFCKMAEASLEDASEKARFCQSLKFYRRSLQMDRGPDTGPLARAS